MAGARLRAATARRVAMHRHRGDAVQCPLCGHAFAAFRAPGVCWRCGSHPRHRGLRVFFDARPELLAGASSFLHFAPEWSLERYLRPHVGGTYVTADLDPSVGERTLDLMALDVADGAFDAILCSHVLEHVPDDRTAIAELTRALAPGGWVAIMVPVDHDRETTYEDPAVVSPEDRLREFRQADHLRLYGRDAPVRFGAAGLGVTVTRPIDLAGPQLSQRFGLLGEDWIYLGVKGSA